MNGSRITVVMICKDRVACRNVRSYDVEDGYLTICHDDAAVTKFAPGQWSYFTVGGIGDG